MNLYDKSGLRSYHIMEALLRKAKFTHPSINASIRLLEIIPKACYTLARI